MQCHNDTRAQRFTKGCDLAALQKPSCATQSKFVRLDLTVTGLANEWAFLLQSRNSGGSVTPKECVGST